jgi:hydrogenase maturation protein HypF
VLVVWDLVVNTLNAPPQNNSATISLSLPLAFPIPVLALGGEQKSRFCLARGDTVLLSPTFGDLRFADNFLAYRDKLEAACREEQFIPRVIAHDLHPGYATSLLAPGLVDFFTPRPALKAVQHHHAHLASVIAAHGIRGPVIGVIWDGSGYGEDGAIWGGEFLVGTTGSFNRAAHLEYLPLPGGEKAIEEPWRMTVSCLHHLRGDDFLDLPIPAVESMNREETALMLSMIDKGINSPLTSSMGRLFDAVSALIGTGWINRTPAEAAIALEQAAAAGGWSGDPYPFRLNRNRKPYIIELNQLFSALISDISEGTAREAIASRFHSTVIAIGSEVTGVLAEETGLRDVVLSGGVFANRIIRSGLAGALEARGLNLIMPEILSIGDESLALGQAAVAAV